MATETKLTAALANLEKARDGALQAALADRAYRVLGLFDPEGPVQRAVEKAKRMIESPRGRHDTAVAEVKDMVNEPRKSRRSK